MNKNVIITSLIGGIIIFLWQFISWAAVNFHSVNQKYTPNQDAILECLKANITEDGSYFIPNVPPGTSTEDEQKHMEASFGKPWVLLSYHSSMDASMGMNMLRALSADIVAVFLLTLLFGMMQSINIKKGAMICIAIGLIGYLTTEYSQAIWFQVNSWPDLLDAIVPWGLCGAWLGFWTSKT